MDTNTARTIDTLTAAQVRFIRKNPDSIVFRFKRFNSGCERATLEFRNKSKAELTIACDFRFTCYTRDASLPAIPSSCFAMIHVPSMDQVWLTIADMLKAGDKLCLDFQADANSNEYAKYASGTGNTFEKWERLHLDVLNLRIMRGKKILTFKVATGCCPANTARMIQY